MNVESAGRAGEEGAWHLMVVVMHILYRKHWSKMLKNKIEGRSSCDLKMVNEHIQWGLAIHSSLPPKYSPWSPEGTWQPLMLSADFF